ncbi:MAG: type IV pilus assembly protein PilM [bacterium]
MSPLLSVSEDFFGLDIGSSAIRLVQLRGSGASKTLVKYSYVPIDSRISMSDSASDRAKLAGIIQQLVSKTVLSTKNVAVGIPSNRVFTTIADVDRLPPKELANSIKLQADSLIPTPIDESKIDWAVIGDSPTDKTKQSIILTSIPNKYVEDRLDMLEAIGLNVVAFEPDNLAMARALTPQDATPHIIIDIGRRSGDLVIIKGGIPFLTRSVPTGVGAIVKSATDNLNVDQKQAEQFVFKFGMVKTKLEGQVYNAIVQTVDMLATEIEKSIKFYQSKYAGEKINNIILTGGASAIPEFPLYLANRFGINIEIGNSWRNVAYSQSRQSELLALSSQFAVAAGLAERKA